MEGPVPDRPRGGTAVLRKDAYAQGRAEDVRMAASPSPLPAMLRPARVRPVIALVAILLPLFSHAAGPLWSAKLSEKVVWHDLTGLGTLMIGTKSSLMAFDPDTGEQLWKRDDIKNSTAHSAREVAGTPYLLCNDITGVGGNKVTLQAIDYLTGETIWKTDTFSGQYLGTFPVPAKGIVVFVLNAWEAAEGAGTYLHAYDLLTGEAKWQTKFCKSNAIPLHIADGSGKFMPRMDLSGYHDPLIEGDVAYLGYLGIHCLDLNTGAIKWGVEFPPGNKGLKRTYAPLRIVGDRIYGAGGGSVYAINKDTGAVIWKSDRISSYAGLFKARDNALVSQLEIVGDKVFIRFGGNFSNGQQVLLMEPLGVAAFDEATGDELYKFTKVKEGLTNLMVLPEINTVMFADAYKLYGLDVSAPQPVETFAIEIEFKRKMGGGEVAKIGLGVLGGVSGIVKASMAQSKNRLDVPVAILRRDGHVIVQGKQHLMGFEPTEKRVSWSTYYAAPGNAFADAALFAVTAAAGIAGNAVATPASIGSDQWNQGYNLVHQNLDTYNRYAGRRKSATQAGSDHVFVLTTLGEGRKKGIGLMGINLDTGEGEKQLMLDDKEPLYAVDDAIGRLFYLKGGKSIAAYDL